MGKIWKISFLLFAVLFLFPGCAKKDAIAPMPLVTGVLVTCKQDGEVLERRYTDPDKVDAVLHYLLRLHPYGVADRDPERVCGDVYKIEVLLSDGEKHIYRQRADRYISKDCQVWRLIDPTRAAELYPLLEAMQSDIP